jgi:exopolysaccharide production protein ExoZ
VKLANLEIVRFCAALTVVIYHSVGILQTNGHSIGWLADTYFIGQAGVDVFFIVSGFVIWLSLNNSVKDPFTFMKNRIIRIIPSYWLITIVTAFIWVISELIQKSLDIRPIDFKSMIQSLFLVRGLIGESNPVVIIGWTLELEMLFYVVIAISLMFRSLSIVFVSSAISLTSIAILVENQGRLIEFLIGMSIAVFYKKRRVSRSLNITILGLGIAGILSTSVISFGGVPIWNIWAICSSAIVFGAVNLPQVQFKTAHALGSASYSVYLIQWLTIPFAALVLEFFPEGKITTIMFLIACVCITQTAGLLYHFRFEKPLIDWLRKKYVSPHS